MVEVVVLLGSFVALCMVGMPVAYTLGLAAISARSGSTCRWRR
jgi:hypothetical protein